MRWKDIFKKQYHLRRILKNLPHLMILKTINVSFSQKHLFFQKNPNFKRFEYSYYSFRIKRQICRNLIKINFHGQQRNEYRFSVNAIGKHRLKNVEYGPFEQMILLPHFIIWRKIMNRKLYKVLKPFINYNMFEMFLNSTINI